MSWTEAMAAEHGGELGLLDARLEMAERELAGTRAALRRIQDVVGLRRHGIQTELLERMLEAAEHTGEVITWSPLEVSKLLGLPLGTAAYHVRCLHADGLLLLDHESRVRGAVQHHYVLNVLSS